MKFKPIAILITVMMLTSAVFTPPVRAAEQTTPANDVDLLPDWIPNDLESAIEFRNTYGATHIGGQNESDLLCVVFQEPNYSKKKYDIKNTAGLVTVFYHDVFVDEGNDTAYEVMTYKNAATSKPDFKVQFSCDSKVQKEYSFTSFGTQVAETDIYSWLPDCEKEYWDYVDPNSHLSVKDNYVVFCLSHGAGTGYDWTLNDEGKKCFELVTEIDCSPVFAVPVDGGQINKIYVYKAFKDGYDKISYDFGAVYATDEETKKTLVADCAVINNAQTILLSGDMRVTLVDSDTDELITLPEGAMPRIWTEIHQITSEGEINCNMQPSGLRNNPGIVRLGNYFDGFNFSFGLVGDGLPSEYSLPDTEDGSAGYYNGAIVPENHITVKKYANDTADVVFRLKKIPKRVLPEEKSAELTDLKKGETRITVYDKDTGELIPSELVKHHDVGFGTDIRFRSNMSPNGWVYTGPIYAVKANPQVYQTDLANLYRSADYFEFLCDDQPEITLYDNGAMDLVIRTKITVSGNINGDSEFSIADVVALQKWLLNAYDKDIYNWAEADFDLDNKITIFDLVLMRKALLKLINLPVEVSVKEETGGVVGAVYLYKVYRVGDTYYLSYQDMTTDQYPQPLAVKITESEYREIMAQDYESMIRNMNVQNEPEFGEGSYTLELSYSDDSKKKAASARMPDFLEKLRVLKEKYFNFVEPDNRLLYGSMFTVVKDGLKLYLGPDESYRSVDNIPKGTQLYEIGYQKDNDIWLFTKYNGQYGWLRMVEDDNSTITIYYADVVAKPVIYLYPEEKNDVHVELELTEADLSTTYPRYNNGWDVTASPDGSLLNKSDGTHHKYLFWDASNCRTRFDFSKGFCVAGSDTESFLKEKLTYMGLTEEEMNEFIIYWLPLMEHNRYNLIVFQDDAYTNSAKLNITPTPDSILRVFMTYVPLKEAVDIQPQQLETFERKGFTVVEWGGSEIKA